MSRALGQTGLRVNPIGLGAMPLSIHGRPDETQAFEVIRAFVEGGGDFIDTANVYCMNDADIGHNERLICAALNKLGQRDRVIIATKGGLRRPGGDWVVDGDPEFLRRSCDQSLTALGVEKITLYQLHAVDTQVGLAASLETLIRLREAGKIEHIGLSNVTLAQLREALALTPIASVQNRCNPYERSDFDNGMVAFCQQEGIAYLPHSPVGGHTGHIRLAHDAILQGLASEYQVSAYVVVLAWLLAKGELILPIPGASKPASILDSLKAPTLILRQDDLRAIDSLADGR